MKKLLSIILCFYTLLVPIWSDYIDIITYFDLSDFCIDLTLMEPHGYTIRTFNNPEACLPSASSPEVKKILFFGDVWNSLTVAKFPREKRVLFMFEPHPVMAWYYTLFPTVFTFKDSHLDNKKYFKVHYPCLLPMKEDLTPFHERKFCTMVASNWNFYTGRKQILQFFEKTKPYGEFEYFGKKPGPYIRDYRGRIPGHW